MANPIGRYIGLVVVLLLSLHLLLFVSHTRYSELTSERIKDMKEKFLGAGDPRRPWADVGSDVSDVSVGKGTYANETLAGVHREKAAIVVLARNSDLWEVLKSMRHMEGTSLALARPPSSFGSLRYFIRPIQPEVWLSVYFLERARVL